jgi:2',3'-cyclic-nucleotide 2'-phosphodiesterase (5'-nucleotidase family)
MNSWTRSLPATLILIVLCLGLRAQTVPVRILQTSDIHAAVEHGRDDGGPGGWLRIATLIGTLRAEAGVDHTIVIDCGDACQGSIVGVLTRGAIGPALLNAIGYDVWVPGNHEFDFGPRRYVELCDQYKGTLLCGNVRVPVDGKLRSWPAWKMMTVGGARIAVIGYNASHLHDWYFGAAGRFEVDLVAKDLPKVMPEILKAKPDAIVLAIHHGWLEVDHRNVNEIPEIVRLFPEIDLILGAHTHRGMPGQMLGAKTWYVQPPPHAEGLVQVDMKVDTNAHRVAGIESKLVQATADVAEADDVARAVAPMLAEARRAAAREVGELAAAVSSGGTPGIDCGTAELLCRVLAEASDSSVVIHGRLSQATLSAGTVTERDLFELVPYENEIFTARLTPDELETVLAEQWKNRRSYVYCGLYGVEADINGEAVSLGTVAPAMLGKDGRIQVAFNSYTAAGGGGRFPKLKGILDQPASQLQGTGTSTRDALRAFLAAHPNLRLSPKVWLRKTE